MPVGYAFGDIKPTDFKIVVTDVSIQRQEFVQFWSETYNTYILGQITNIFRRGIADKSTLDTDEVLKILREKKTTNSSNLIATVQVLGYADKEGIVNHPAIPIRPGTHVEKASSSIITDVLQISRVRGECGYVGLLMGHDDIRCYLSLNRVFGQHCAVLASTGRGKSYLIGVIVEELIKKDVPVVIIDPHGEYTSISRINTNQNDLGNMDRFGITPKAYPNKIVEYSPDIETNTSAIQLRFSDKDISAMDIIALTNIDQSKAQVSLLYDVIYKLNEMPENSEGWRYDFPMLIEAVKNSKSRAKFPLIEQLNILASMPIFESPPIRITDFVKNGQVVIINLRGVDEKLQDLVVYRLSRRLFDARRKGKIPAFVYVVEEAHNFCPQQGVHKRVGDVLKTIASEGRKFGANLLVCSQRTAKINKDVLSQCSTQFYLQMTNPADISAVADNIENYREGMDEDIKNLPVGTCLVTGVAVPVPIYIKVRTRETEHGGKTIKLVGKEDTDNV